MIRAVLALLGLIYLTSVAEGQPSRGEAEIERASSGWDGRPVTRGCRAAVGDLDALKATLVEHEKVRIGFKNKIRHGVFSGGELSGGAIRATAPAFLLQKITRHLAELGRSEKTLALIYDIGISNRGYALCIWLITSDGVEEAATVQILEQSAFRHYSAAAAVRSGLGVEGRAAARSPRLRNGQAIEPPSRPAHDNPERLRDEAWQLLAPPAIAAKLEASDATRLLVLPVSDIGLVPFAALPIGQQRLIDRFALVLLPDVEALFDLTSEGHAWDSEHHLRSIVVGDPDLSHDQRWEFPPLPGARSEAVEVADLVGEYALLGKEATRDHFLDQLNAKRDAGLIYLATHALSDGVNPMDGSFLGLAGGHLYGRDIKGLTFSNNPLVVMSACQTGLGKVFEGGTFGLVRAWYHVGAPQIVMSLWNIDDQATKDTMLGFMRRLKAGERAEFALQHAMLATRANYADPALWASLALFGLPSKAIAANGSTAPVVALQREPPNDLPVVSSLGPTIGAPQRVALYEEDPENSAGKR